MTPRGPIDQAVGGRRIPEKQRKYHDKKRRAQSPRSGASASAWSGTKAEVSEQLPKGVNTKGGNYSKRYGRTELKSLIIRTVPAGRRVPRKGRSRKSQDDTGFERIQRMDRNILL